LNYGEVAGTGAFEHASGIDADLAIRLGNIGSIVMSAARPLFPRKPTSIRDLAMSHSCHNLP
jgi:hypothetical protein